MTGRVALMSLLLSLATACHPAPKVDATKPEAFARTASLQPAPGGKLQRVTVPVALLAAVKRRDLGDIRLFDATGRVVPMALLDARLTYGGHETELRLYPVAGTARDLRRPELSIRIEAGGTARAVTVDRSADSTEDAVETVAVLLDTRAVQEPVTAIVLKADTPVGRPITLTLRSSDNLKDWEPFAEKVLFRPAAGAPMLGGSEVALDGMDLRGRYVSISWGESRGVTVIGASAVASGLASRERGAIATRAAALTDPHQLRFDLPEMPRLSGVRVTYAGDDGVLPVQLFGRSPGDDRWALLSAATLQPGGGSSTLDLPGAPVNAYRLKVDDRTAGFSASPKLDLLLDPIDLLVALSGTPPYRLSAGQADAEPNYLSLSEIVPQGRTINLARLPSARVDASGGPPIIVLKAGMGDGAIDRRKWILWASLLLGTLVLAFAAVRLLRTNSKGRDGAHEGTGR